MRRNRNKAVFVRTWSGEQYVLDKGKVKMFTENEAKEFIKESKNKHNILKAKIITYKL